MTAIHDEMQQILAQSPTGLMTAANVLEYARQNKKSAIHAYLKRKRAFEPAVAAERYQLLICQQLIRQVKVRYTTSENRRIPVRVFVSLDTDREAGGGYRAFVHVMSNEEQRASLLRTAMAELERLRTKYGHLEELAPVFAAIPPSPDKESAA